MENCSHNYENYRCSGYNTFNGVVIWLIIISLHKLHVKVFCSIHDLLGSLMSNNMSGNNAY